MGRGGGDANVWDYIEGREGILFFFNQMFSVSALSQNEEKGWGSCCHDSPLVRTVTVLVLDRQLVIQPIFSVSALSQNEGKGWGSCCHYSPLVRTDNQLSSQYSVSEFTLKISLVAWQMIFPTSAIGKAWGSEADAFIKATRWRISWWMFALLCMGTNSLTLCYLSANLSRGLSVHGWRIKNFSAWLQSVKDRVRADSLR